MKIERICTCSLIVICYQQDLLYFNEHMLKTIVEITIRKVIFDLELNQAAVYGAIYFTTHS